MTAVTPFAENLFGQRRDDISEDRLRTLEGRLADTETAITVLGARALGYVAGDLGNINSSAAMALSKAATETVYPTSNAIATVAGRRYKITAAISTTSGGAWNWAALRIRRGTTTGGTQIAIAYSGRPGGTGTQSMLVVAYDVPGAQAAQQWCMSHQLDTSICDLYAPSFISVEDVGTG